MIYTNLYHNFISSRPKRTRVAFDGLERHHIIPRSIGGTNDKSNLIVLTPREHFIAHRILVKMCKGDDATKMALALHRMATGSHKIKYKISSRTYQYLRELRSKAYQDWLQTPKGIAFRQKQSQRGKDRGYNCFGRRGARPIIIPKRPRIPKVTRYSFIGPKLPRKPRKGVKWTDERRAKARAIWTPERRALVSQRNKILTQAMWRNPEYRAKNKATWNRKIAQAI